MSYNRTVNGCCEFLLRSSVYSIIFQQLREEKNKIDDLNLLVVQQMHAPMFITACILYVLRNFP